MKKICRLVKWIIRAWPVLIVLALIIIHLLLFSCFQIDEGIVNAIVGPGLQLVGGFFVVLSINNNIKDFRNKNILSMLTQYIKSCPCIKHRYGFQVDSGSLKMTRKLAAIYVNKTWNTEEEGLKELERRIEDLRRYVSENDKELREELSAVQKKFDIQISKNNKEIKEVSNLLDKSIMGDIKYQILGIFLIIYGFVINILQIINISKYN